MRILGVIPSRFASTRFPGKPLVDILGKSMIMRVYEQASRATSLSDLYVATDDERIMNHVIGCGGKAIMTLPDHQSGTDRCAEVLDYFPDVTAVINIQGDEPMLDPGQIDQVAGCFENPDTELATLVSALLSNEDLSNPAVVKVVKNIRSEAMYFSRSAIPFVRAHNFTDWSSQHAYYRHIGIYGYRRDMLELIKTLKPSSLELAESLEQLRWLENGLHITVRETSFDSRAVDTPEDLAAVISMLRGA